MLNFDPPVVRRSRWLQICNRLGVVVRGRKRLDGFTKLVIVVVAAVLIPKIGSTFAGTITLNAGQSVEFGQGTVMTTACDESITITPTSRFSTVDTTFYLGDITVSGIDEVECSDDMFTITVFDQNGSPIDICEENFGEETYTSNALQLEYQDSDDSWVLISDCFINQGSGGSVGSTTGFVFVPSANIDSSEVSSISIESALSTTADDVLQAVELNGSNTGTLSVSTTNATLEVWEGLYDGDFGYWAYTNTVWFKWTANADGNLTIDTCDSDFDTVIQAFDDGISIAADDWENADCIGDQVDPSEISFDMVLGREYFIQVGGYNGDYGLAQLNWTFVAGSATYSVTYNGNTSTSGAVPADTGSYSSGAVVTVASNSGTLAKTGYAFDDWCTTQSAAGAACSGTSQAVASTFTITRNTTLYAQWTGNPLTVTTDEQGGTAIGNASTTSGASMSSPGTPTRSGYEFDGWFAASTGGSAITFSYTHGRTADFTLYAQWVETAQFSVGDAGPGGGTIFYVNMRRPVGSQYFEAACAGWQNDCDGTTVDPTAEWGCDSSLISGADGTAIGTGELNTADILASCSNAPAALLADGYRGGGFSDWFLPSANELSTMYTNRVQIGGFTTGDWPSRTEYWSSSEYDEGAARVQYFKRQYYGHELEGSSYKFESVSVRPVRSFTVPNYSVGQTGPGGGIIFYVDLTRPVGSQYFEAACAGWQNDCDGTTADPTARWGCDSSLISGADGAAIGTGEQNTADILAGCATLGIAARLADGYSNSGDSDWFLPSPDELNKMYVKRALVGGFSIHSYWSSRESDQDYSYTQDFNNYGTRDGAWKNSPYVHMRPVRSF